jgi:membrane-bound serine protease (ClpP class)
MSGGGAAAEAAPPSGAGSVDIVQVEGRLDHISAQFLLDRIRAGPREGAQVIIITVDSASSYRVDPSELAAATRSSPVPIVSWVGGQGAVAKGAARELVAATDLRAVAPGARVEPPVPVDITATAIGDVVVGLDGRQLKGIELHTARLTIGPAGSPRREPSSTTRFFKPGFFARLLRAVTSPNVAVFLFLVGLSAVAFEFFTVGIGLAGAAGALCLVLSFFGLMALPTRWLGVVVIGVGLLAYAHDVQRARRGASTWTATALIAIGMAVVFWGAPSELRLTWWLAVLFVALVLFFWAVAMPVMVRARYSTNEVRRQPLVGEEGVASTTLAPTGFVKVREATWGASSAGGTIGAGEPIEVVRVEGVTLIVGPAQEDR